MFCQYCGKPIEEDAHFCTNCGAAQNTAVIAHPKQNLNIKPILITIAVIAVVAIIIAVIASAGGSGAGLSGRWEAVFEDDGYYHTPYTIEFSSNGNCIIYEYGRNPYSATYTATDSGTYVTSQLLTSVIFGSWTIKKEGKYLIINGSGLPYDTIFKKVG